MRRALATAVSWLFVACTPPAGDTTWTEIALRDPRHVAVSIATPAGPETLSPPDAPAGVTYLPETVPPFTVTDCPGARLVRGQNGALVLERRWSATRDEMRSRVFRWDGVALVGADGRAVLFGDASRWTGDELRWVVTMTRTWHVTQARGMRALSEPVVKVELAVSRSNVLAVTEGRTVPGGAAVMRLYPPAR